MNSSSLETAHSMSANSNSSGKAGGYQSAEALVLDGIKHACQHLTMKLSDIHMASRRAAEAATRRADVAAWINNILEVPRLPEEPSEEELKGCLSNGSILCQVMNKLNPGSISKIVSNPSLTSAEGAAHSAYQRFENVRNFLVAIEELKLPTFEASDLEQGHMVTVVDCLLSLKEYYDSRYWADVKNSWRQGTDLANSNDVKSIRAVSPGKPVNAIAKSGNQPRKRWALPDSENFTVLDQVGDQKGVKWPFRSFNAESLLSTPIMSDSTSGWIQHIGQKFQEVLQLKAGRYPDLKAVESSGMLNFVDNAPSQSILSLIGVILGDKQNEEAPSDACLQLIELMLRKIMEEFERRLLSQGQQMKKLKYALREVLAREERIAARSNLLETLVAGSGEEIKLLMDEMQKTKDEQMRMEDEIKSKENDLILVTNGKREVELALQNLQEELEKTKKLNQEQVQHIESEKEITILRLREKLSETESLLAKSKQRNEELEALSELKMQHMKLKDSGYQNFLNKHLHQLQDVKLLSETTKGEVCKLQEIWLLQFENLEKEIKGLANAASNYYKVLAENRQLYNEVQDLKGNIRVYCRVRPFLPGQPAKQTTIEYIGENGELIIVNPYKQGKDSQRLFAFNKVFGPSATQEEVFLDTRPLIRSVLDGYNVCIFAYGQTGSGKTFTMAGPNSASEENWGVNYRALNDLFQISLRRKDVFKYEVAVQMIEIYNEQVRDLLTSEGGSKKLGIRSVSQPNGLSVPDAIIIPVESTLDVLELMKIGQRNRAVGSTALNERSSRSHSVLTVHVQGTDLSSGTVLRGSLHLIDLAGSERVERSEVTGDRLKEAQHINKSLSALGDVISALANKSSHVPYRNSKLTQILQDSLGGHAKTLMFVQLNPDVESYSETVSTLKFAERVSGVELGAARTNKESKDIKDLKEQIVNLKDVVAKKDAEIERLNALKESKDVSSNVEKRRVKPNNSPGQQQNMCTGGQGYRSMLSHLQFPGRPTIAGQCFNQSSQFVSNDGNARIPLGSKMTSNIAGSQDQVGTEANDKVGKVTGVVLGDESSKVLDADDYSENSDRHSDFGLPEQSGHLSSYKEYSSSPNQDPSNRRSSQSSLGSAADHPDDAEHVGLRDVDLDERLSELSDGDLSMGTETDGSISSVVENFYPDKKESDKLPFENEKRRVTPSRIPRPPLKSQQKTLLAQSNSRIGMGYGGSVLADPSRRKSTGYHTTADPVQRKSASHRSEIHRPSGANQVVPSPSKKR